MTIELYEPRHLADRKPPSPEIEKKVKSYIIALVRRRWRGWDQLYRMVGKKFRRFDVQRDDTNSYIWGLISDHKLKLTVERNLVIYKAA